MEITPLAQSEGVECVLEPVKNVKRRASTNLLDSKELSGRREALQAFVKCWPFGGLAFQESWKNSYSVDLILEIEYPPEISEKDLSERIRVLKASGIRLAELLGEILSEKSVRSNESKKEEEPRPKRRRRRPAAEGHPWRKY